MTLKNKSELNEGLKTNKLELLYFTGGVHPVASVADEPDISLSHWGIFHAWDKVGKKTLHGVGWNGEGRASTAIVEFLPRGTDEDSLIRFKTASGRLYELVGSPGLNGDAAYVWGVWKNINGITKAEDVSNEYYSRK